MTNNYIPPLYRAAFKLATLGNSCESVDSDALDSGWKVGRFCCPLAAGCSTCWPVNMYGCHTAYQCKCIFTMINHTLNMSLTLLTVLDSVCYLPITGNCECPTATSRLITVLELALVLQASIFQFLHIVVSKAMWGVQCFPSFSCPFLHVCQTCMQEDEPHN